MLTVTDSKSTSYFIKSNPFKFKSVFVSQHTRSVTYELTASDVIIEFLWILSHVGVDMETKSCWVKLTINTVKIPLTSVESFIFSRVKNCLARQNHAKRLNLNLTVSQIGIHKFLLQPYFTDMKNARGPFNKNKH